MTNEPKVHDPKGNLIVKGSRVQTEWFDDEDGERVEHCWLGTVSYITDAEGDVDDEGRPYAIEPKVYVQWDSEFADPGDLEDFSAHGYSYYSDPEYECDELEVVNG